jgi:hypothetical protein
LKPQARGKDQRVDTQIHPIVRTTAANVQSFLYF